MSPRKRSATGKGKVVRIRSIRDARFQKVNESGKKRNKLVLGGGGDKIRADRTDVIRFENSIKATAVILFLPPSGRLPIGDPSGGDAGVDLGDKFTAVIVPPCGDDGIPSERSVTVNAAEGQKARREFKVLFIGDPDGAIGGPQPALSVKVAQDPEIIIEP